jgi:hypothetical protein
MVTETKTHALLLFSNRSDQTGVKDKSHSFMAEQRNARSWRQIKKMQMKITGAGGKLMPSKIKFQASWFTRGSC